MKQYLDLALRVYYEGIVKGDRTGTGTTSIFGHQMRFDLQEGFPLVTTKDMMKENSIGVTRLDQIIYELLWFLKGDTNLKYLLDHHVHIWNRDAWRQYLERTEKELYSYEQLTYHEFIEQLKENEMFALQHGDLGPIYGAQWRSWGDYEGSFAQDQIKDVIEGIKTTPHSRRHIVTAWNPNVLAYMAIPPCHVLFQFYVRGEYLDCQLYQRSGDIFLGVPFNIASYALLTMMIAQVTGYKPGEFIHTLGDAHIYNNHLDQISEQLNREPKTLPKMVLNPRITDIDDFQHSDFVLTGYDAHPEIKGKQSF